MRYRDSRVTTYDFHATSHKELLNKVQKFLDSRSWIMERFGSLSESVSEPLAGTPRTWHATVVLVTLTKEFD